MTSIPREMIEKRAAEIAQQEDRPANDLDLARAEELLQEEMDAGKQDHHPDAEVDAPEPTKEGLDRKGNPAPPPH